MLGGPYRIGGVRLGKEDRIYIEKEHGTGWVFYILRVNGAALCSSKNMASMPRAYTDPIQTYNLINDKTFTTYRNPAYEHITIVPGLNLVYPVYYDINTNPIAKMERVFRDDLSSFCQYYIFDESNANPIISIDTESQKPMDQELSDWLPHNAVTVSIYLDESFEYDSRSLVEKRYVVSVAEKHLQWLPHIFHAYYLKFNA